MPDLPKSIDFSFCDVCGELEDGPGPHFHGGEVCDLTPVRYVSLDVACAALQSSSAISYGPLCGEYPEDVLRHAFSTTRVQGTADCEHGGPALACRFCQPNRTVCTCDDGSAEDDRGAVLRCPVHGIDARATSRKHANDDAKNERENV